MPTVTEQHGITGVVAVFHWQTVGPLQSTFSQGSGRRVFWTRDTEAQLRGVVPGPQPHVQQASFMVINERDVDCARADQGVLAGVQCIGREYI